MTVTRSKHPFQTIYKIGSDTLEIVNKYIGIIISRDLDWKPHINSIVLYVVQILTYLLNYIVLFVGQFLSMLALFGVCAFAPTRKL